MWEERVISLVSRNLKPSLLFIFLFSHRIFDNKWSLKTKRKVCAQPVPSSFPSRFQQYFIVFVIIPMAWSHVYKSVRFPQKRPASHVPRHFLLPDPSSPRITSPVGPSEYQVDQRLPTPSLSPTRIIPPFLKSASVGDQDKVSSFSFP